MNRGVFTDILFKPKEVIVEKLGILVPTSDSGESLPIPGKSVTFQKQQDEKSDAKPDGKPEIPPDSKGGTKPESLPSSAKLDGKDETKATDKSGTKTDDGKPSAQSDAKADLVGKPLKPARTGKSKIIGKPLKPARTGKPKSTSGKLKRPSALPKRTDAKPDTRPRVKAGGKPAPIPKRVGKPSAKGDGTEPEGKGDKAKPIEKPAADAKLEGKTGEPKVVDRPTSRPVSKRRTVVFGRTVDADETYVDGFTWIYNFVVGSAVSDKEQEVNARLMRPLLRPVHPQCIPVHEPKQAETKRSWKERLEWYEQNSKPKPVPPKPELKKKRRRTKPRSPGERRKWERENCRPKPVPKPPSFAQDMPKKSYDEMLPRLIELSRPTRIYEKSPPPDYVNRKSFDYVMTERMEALAKPRALDPEYVKDLEYDFDEKIERARRYKPTERIIKLAQPKPHPPPKEEINEFAFTVNPAALKYKPTQRILDLAKPRMYEEEPEVDPFAVKESAKRYKMTPRMEELAKPRDRAAPGPNPWAFQVNPQALKYKITPRMIELAQPKKDPMFAKHNCFRVVK
ncbi:hypothetical protein M8J77_016677 [Diaphorina citri]|nr:hypothetical protein M8J77_016677 [Diaphorina citri]